MDQRTSLAFAKAVDVKKRQIILQEYNESNSAQLSDEINRYTRKVLYDLLTDAVVIANMAKRKGVNTVRLCTRVTNKKSLVELISGKISYSDVLIAKGWALSSGSVTGSDYESVDRTNEGVSGFALATNGKLYLHSQSMNLERIYVSPTPLNKDTSVRQFKPTITGRNPQIVFLTRLKNVRGLLADFAVNIDQYLI